MKYLKVFLGGTCGKSNWRQKVIENIKLSYFNPVVENWTKECIEEEYKQKEICDYNLFVITSEMKGVFSIAEAVDLSNKKPDKLIFCILKDGFDKGQLKSLYETLYLIKKNGGTVFMSLDDCIDYLNARQDELIAKG